MRTNSKTLGVLPPESWGLDSSFGTLSLHGTSLADLAHRFGTPLHIINEPRLISTAMSFQSAVSNAYRGNTSVHFPLKCNAVPGVLQIMRTAGLRAEVMTEHELDVALRAGFAPSELIVNGPYKPTKFLEKCVTLGVKLIIVDSHDELIALSNVACVSGNTVDVLLRVDPGHAARKGNWLSGVASRSVAAIFKSRASSSFGFSLLTGEAELALRFLSTNSTLRFRGFHFHIGTGIHDVENFRGALRCLPQLRELARSHDLHFDILDVGGGLASETTREFTSGELLSYQAFGTLPEFKLSAPDAREPLFQRYATTIAAEVHRAFDGEPLPLLLFEPGRSVVSANGILLLSVVGRKRRSEQEQWAVCDGGLSTVSMPTYYEYHEVLPCTGMERPRDHTLTLLGPGCFAGDVIYRNKRMPDLAIGETIAIMDAGAYFTSLESAYGHPRPMTIAVGPHEVRILRDRETLSQMTERDRLGLECATVDTDPLDFISQTLNESNQLEPCAST